MESTEVADAEVKLEEEEDMLALNSIPAQPRTLIADDQPDVLAALRLLLKGEGYQTETVTSPSAVIEALESRDFDLVLMDLNYARDTTSGEEGLDLLTRIQTLDSSIPIVVMTAWGSIELAVEAMRRGVRDFVQKPWDNSRLLGILRTQIEQGYKLRKRKRLKAGRRILASDLLDAVDLQGMLERVAEHLHETINNQAVVVFTKSPRDQVFSASAAAGTPAEILSRLKFEPGSTLLSQLGDLADIQQLSLEHEDRFKLGQAQASLIVPMRLKGDLIGFLTLGQKLSGQEYDAEERRYLGGIVEQIVVGIDNLRLRSQEQEVQEAREIQLGLLPREIPQVEGCRIAHAWRPAFTVSGDYFDVLKLSEDEIALCIADVVGKGMPAAMLMSNVQAAVKASAAIDVSPKALCEKVNRVICGNIAANRFITLVYCSLRITERALRYCNAGHNWPLLVRQDGSVERLTDGGIVLGVFPDAEYSEGEVALTAGDRLLLYTDGLTEALSDSGEEFGEERLLEVILRHRAKEPSLIQAAVMDAVSEFTGGTFHDDATLLVVAVS